MLHTTGNTIIRIFIADIKNQLVLRNQLFNSGIGTLGNTSPIVFLIFGNIEIALNLETLVSGYI